MSFQRKSVFASLPQTTRGKPVLLGGDPKGNNILYTCGNSVIIRNIKTPGIADVYSEHQHAPTVARYAPSGFYIASGDVSGTVRIWDTTQAEHPLKIELRPLSGTINDLAWSDDSKRIVAVGEGKEKFGAAFFWDSGASVGEITGHSKPITTVDFKQTRPYRVATGSEDFLVNWFEGPPFKYKFALRDHSRFVNCVRFSPNGNLLVSVGQDKKGIFYDGKTGEKKHELSAEGAHGGGIYAVSWSPDSTKLLTASGDKTAKIWDAETGKCLSTHTFGKETEDQQLGCIWQGEYLITMDLAGRLHYLDQNNPSKPTQTLLGHNKFVTAFAHNKANNSFYSGSYDAVIVRWDVEHAATETFSGKGHTNQINKMRVSGDDLVTAAMDNSVRFTSLSGKAYKEEDKLGLDSPVQDVAVGNSSSLAVAVTMNNIVVIRNKKVASQTAVGWSPKAVAISKDESEVLVGGEDNNIYVYSLSGNNLTQKSKLEGHRGPLTAIEYSNDGKLFASADKNRDIFVWDNATKTQKITGWVFHTARINSLAWSPDDSHLASGALDQNIFIWNISSPSTRIQIKNSHYGGVNAVFWFDNTTVASAGQDCTVKTWALKF
eukprot:TRINITY_DN683_c0_g1_i1.p1 TRINITY_DN683_c0_g1~~TRINITY_DN683_c0_g1_i1.p1  ORF type:complete len:603 (+),score=164.15 TRINITY_DN683_c0_g1_i1:90-1898(+)